MSYRHARRTEHSPRPEVFLCWRMVLRGARMAKPEENGATGSELPAAEPSDPETAKPPVRCPLRAPVPYEAGNCGAGLVQSGRSDRGRSRNLQLDGAHHDHFDLQGL